MNPRDYENIYGRKESEADWNRRASSYGLWLQRMEGQAAAAAFARSAEFLRQIQAARERKPLVWTRDDRAFLASIKVKAD